MGKEYCYAEKCRYRHWTSGGMPTHRKGADCPDQDDLIREFPRQTAERLAAEKYPPASNKYSFGLNQSPSWARNAYVSGFLDGRSVSAAVLEAAAQAMHESNRQPGGTGWHKQFAYIKDRYRVQARAAFRAAGIRIEGEKS